MWRTGPRIGPRPELHRVAVHRISVAEDYTSENTDRLDVESMRQLLMKLDFIRDLVAGRPAVPVD